MARISFIIGLVCLIIGGWYFLQTRTAYLCDNLSCIHVPRSSSYVLRETYIRTPTLYRALYASGSDYLRIESQRILRKDSDQAVLAAVAQMKAMYEKAPAPYPGDISDAVVCDPDFVPTYKEIPRRSGTLYLFRGYLNNRMTFGSCSKSQAVYKGYLVYMYCAQSQQFVRTEFIYPVSEFAAREVDIEKEIQQVSCGTVN